MSSSEPNIFWKNKTNKELFNTIDKNKDGFISKSELSQSFIANGIPVSEALLSKIMEASDTNKDSKISYEEFQNYTKNQNEKVKNIFNEIDFNKDGKLSKSELMRAITSIDPMYCENNITKILNRIDFDRNKTISMEEFVDFFHMIPINNIRMAFGCFEREGFDIGETISLSSDFVDETKSKK